MEQNRPYCHISTLSHLASKALLFALNISPVSGTQTFCFALIHKEIAILASMRLELEDLRVSELTIILNSIDIIPSHKIRPHPS